MIRLHLCSSLAEKQLLDDKKGELIVSLAAASAAKGPPARQPPVALVAGEGAVEPPVGKAPKVAGEGAVEPAVGKAPKAAKPAGAKASGVKAAWGEGRCSRSGTEATAS